MRRNRRGNGILVALLAVFLAVLLVVLVWVYVVPHPGGNGPCLANCPTDKGIHVVTQVYTGFDSAEQQSVLTKWPQYLRSGDSVEIYSNSVDSTNLGAINSLAGDLTRSEPSGVSVGINTICPASAANAAADPSRDVSFVAMTQEPAGANANMGCGGVYSQQAVVSEFSQLASETHANGKQAIAYPTGNMLLNLVQYGWDYGGFASAVDRINVETQQYANSSSEWSQALGKLVGEFKNADQPLSKLGVQITLGNDNHGTGIYSVSQAVADVNAAKADGISGIYLWVANGAESLGLEVLQALRG